MNTQQCAYDFRGLSSEKGRAGSRFLSLLAVCALVAMGGCKSSSPSGPATPTGGAGIGPDGGTVTSADGKVKLVIPAGALSSTQTIAITPKTDTNTCPQAIDSGYNLTPNGLTFSKPVMLTLSYDTSIAGANAELIGIASQEDTGGWYGWTGGSVDTIHHTATVPIAHFSREQGYLSCAITPGSAVVFTGSTLGFNLDVVGPPLGVPAGSPVKLVNPISILVANWKLSPAIGSIDPSQLSPTTVYTAPSEMPSPNLVTLSATVTSYGATFTPIAFIHVLAKNWKLSISDSIVYSCPSYIQYTYYNGGYLDFEVSPSGDATYDITAYPWIANPSGISNQSLCPQIEPLISNYDVNKGNDLKVNSLTGYYDLGSNSFHLTEDETYADLPGWDLTYKVGGTTKHQDITTGHEQTTVLRPLQPMTTQSYLDSHTSDGFLEDVTITLESQP